MGLNLHGIIPAMVTPMTEAGEVDEAGVRRLARRLLAAGAHALFPVGSTGEAYALDLDEKRRVVAAVMDEARGKVPVMVGAGAPTTREAIDVARVAQAEGAQAVSVITPYFVTPSQPELRDHFAAVAESIDIPLLLYNQPARTHVSISVDVVERLAREGHAVGMKDSSGDLAYTMAAIAACGPEFKVFVGNDAMVLPALFMGARGSVAASGNVMPEVLVGVYEKYRRGDPDGARELQYRVLPLRRAFTLGTFPAVIKEALDLLGHPAGPPRRPATRLTTADREALRAAMQAAGLLP